MLRIILWRLSFDYWNLILFLLSKVNADSYLAKKYNNPVYYFGFGANLSPIVLADRFIKVTSQEDAMVKGYELRFNQAGPFKDCGFASVHEAPQEHVFGRVLQMRKIDEIRMDHYELVTFANRHLKKTLIHKGIACYYYQTTWPEEGLRPTTEYYGKIMQAVEASSIVPPEYLEKMHGIHPIPDAELEPRTEFEFLFRNLEEKPSFLLSILKFYDTMAVQLFLFFRMRSLTAFLLKSIS